MDWIEGGRESGDKVPWRKLEKFTLHEHNAVATVNEDQRTFSCYLNLQRLSRVYHSGCMIEGDMRAGHLAIGSWLMDQTHEVKANWQSQKVEMSRFAFRYNQRAGQSITLRCDPTTGRLRVVLAFLAGQALLEDEGRLRQLVTDLCQSVGQEGEMVFNTVLEMVLGRQAKEPYLKSGLKVNPGLPRYMRIQKLLDKVKSLIATSSFYKIRSDISSAHKNRSYFKKLYLNQEKKLLLNPKVVQLALLHEPKFSRRHEECSRKPRDRNAHFIKDYIQLQQKNEIEFAKHLLEGAEKEYPESALNTTPIQQITPSTLPGLFRLTYPDRTLEVRGRQLEDQELAHEIRMLTAMGRRHPCLPLHLRPDNLPANFRRWLFWVDEEEVPLLEYLRRNSLTLSLSSKLHIMAQMSSFLVCLHRAKIAYFLQPENVFVTRGLQVRVRGFRRSYRVQDWAEKRETDGSPAISDFLLEEEELVEFPFRLARPCELDHEKCDVMSMGVCLYRVLMEKFPFFEGGRPSGGSKEEWVRMWTVQTESFLTKGGELVKILGHLLLKCMDLQDISARPYVEWLLVILSEMRTSLNGLY